MGMHAAVVVVIAAVVVILQLFSPLFDLNSVYRVSGYWSLSTTSKLTGLSIRKEICSLAAERVPR